MQLIDGRLVHRVLTDWRLKKDAVNQGSIATLPLRFDDFNRHFEVQLFGAGWHELS